MLEKKKNVHFIGIGGIGMSALAKLLIGMGYHVSGSDLKESKLTKELLKLGAKVFIGHKGSNVSLDTEVIVYSSAIDSSNPEISAGIKRQMAIVSRAEILAELSNDKFSILVTGAHGKTTTTSLVSCVLSQAGLKPTVVVGGVVENFHSNALLGHSDYFVAEADESDGTFLKYTPTIAVITNIDREHLDYFGDFNNIRAAFKKFLSKIKPGGSCLACYDDKNLLKIANNSDAKIITYGLKKRADVFAADIAMDMNNSSYSCYYKGAFMGKVSLQIPGRHNITNSLAAVGAGMELGIKFDSMAESLSQYKGARRRFQLKASVNDIMVIDDYAHHPTEIMATLSCAKNWPDRRVIAVFQPHRFTRTMFLKEEFGRAFGCVDHLVLTDIYAASEKPIDGVSINSIYESVLKNPHKEVQILKKELISGHLLKIVRPRDMVFLLGAGDITYVCDDFVDALKEKNAKFKK